ncbi:hypothetical protein SKAU_G00174030 [Synaphobranchus kaupii]|uniref:Uncharacterized protein n=1 Tax=Synaphobranchus kaupii TaxID=118154 RepID=A0A9Q1FKW0_SYNKA|nr:hypothetical protein SKAU_G00174030 [Synaphobranchus kaupii]
MREVLKNELAARDDASSLDDLISLSIKVDNRLRERLRKKAGHPFPDKPVPTPYPVTDFTYQRPAPHVPVARHPGVQRTLSHQKLSFRRNIHTALGGLLDCHRTAAPQASLPVPLPVSSPVFSV